MEQHARFESSAVLARFEKLKKRGKDLRQPLRECGQIVLSSIEENFQKQGRFSSAGEMRGGTKQWEKLAPSTKKQRKRLGIMHDKILQRRPGGMADSFDMKLKGNSVEIGTNKQSEKGFPYPAALHYGAPKINLPARPILVVQDEDVEDMIDVLDKHIMS